MTYETKKNNQKDFKLKLKENISQSHNYCSPHYLCELSHCRQLSIHGSTVHNILLLLLLSATISLSHWRVPFTLSFQLTLVPYKPISKLKGTASLHIFQKPSSPKFKITEYITETMSKFANGTKYSFFLLQLALLACKCLGMPPSPPVTCKSGNSSCTVRSAYDPWPDRIPCNASAAFFPTSEDEILRAVAYGARNKLKMKVVTGFSHTIPKLVCPGSGDGTGIIISTRDYNKEIVVNRDDMTVTADSGVGLWELIEAAATSGFALAAAPYWEGLSLGGLLSTGSHGSSLWGLGGALHEYVLSVRLIVPASQRLGYARIVTLREGDPDLNAAKVSLGVLGVISKVTVRVEGLFKRKVTNVVKEDDDLEDEIVDFAGAHEFGDLTWYPYQRRVVHKVDDRATVAAEGNGVNDFIGFRSTPNLVSAALRSTEKMLEKTKNSAGKCKEAKLIVDSKLALANGLKNNDLLFTKYPVVGFQNKMQTSGSCYKSPSSDLVNACPWDPRFRGLFFYETTAIFSLSKIKPFISDVKKLRDMDPESLCGIELYNGFLMRFIRGSTAYLGQPEDSVVIDFNYFRADSGSNPRLNEDIWEEIEQIAFFKHGARPHWAKNRRIAFNGAAVKYPNVPKFLRVMKKFDPDGLFSSDWSDEILHGMKNVEKEEGCALEGLCICEEDRHCAPNQGYLCSPGKVYSDARVCRFHGDNFPSF